MYKYIYKYRHIYIIKEQSESSTESWRAGHKNVCVPQQKQRRRCSYFQRTNKLRAQALVEHFFLPKPGKAIAAFSFLFSYSLSEGMEEGRSISSFFLKLHHAGSISMYILKEHYPPYIAYIDFKFKHIEISKIKKYS